ncbi:MAG: alkaline phosphatase family protein, partial [Deltaproteobacteria bacterium]|nr:alkaline phosphatase family protein [Deltaproteobacteria bacterium]
MKNRHPSRRDVLVGIGGALGAASIGCGQGKGSTPIAGERLPDAAPPSDAPPLDAGNPACSSQSDLSASELLASIDHIVVLMMENRSFDHYLGSLQLVEGRSDIAGLDGSESNPDLDGNPVGVHVLDDFTPEDPPHKWDECHRQWNQGANDGFVREHAGAHQADVMGYHVRDQLASLYALADAGVVCNHWYSSVMGPTWPNRYYLHGATSKGLKSNLPLPQTDLPFAQFESIFDRLDDAGVSHKNYFHDVPWATGAYQKQDGLATMEAFFADAANGALPQFSLIDPQFFGQGANDDHPDHDIRLGQALIASVVSALAQSPLWERSLFVLTYDEHGGFYDHVPPPTTTDSRADFQQLGFRVPSLVVGPHVRRGCAADTVLEHASVISTLTARFGLEPINDRAQAANDLSSCIDPARFDDPLPPPVVPAVE